VPSSQSIWRQTTRHFIKASNCLHAKLSQVTPQLQKWQIGFTNRKNCQRNFGGIYEVGLLLLLNFNTLIFQPSPGEKIARPWLPLPETLLYATVFVLCFVTTGFMNRESTCSTIHYMTSLLARAVVCYKPDHLLSTCTHHVASRTCTFCLPNLNICMFLLIHSRYMNDAAGSVLKGIDDGTLHPEVPRCWMLDGSVM
jgi:hypothetical protein